MFDNLLMSMNSKLKKIISGLETNEGKIDEISTDVGSVGTSVATVQSTSDEIKALIGTEIATQLSALEANVIAAMSSNSGGLTSCVRNVQRGTVVLQQTTVSVTLSGFTDASKMIAIINGTSYFYNADWGTDTDAYVNGFVSSLATGALVISNAKIGGKTHAGGKNHTYSYQVIEFY